MTSSLPAAQGASQSLPSTQSPAIFSKKLRRLPKFDKECGQHQLEKSDSPQAETIRERPLLKVLQRPQHRSAARDSKALASPGTWAKAFLGAAMASAMIDSAFAYPCKVHEPALRFFSNADMTRFGSVHVLYSECSEVLAYCGEDCSTINGYRSCHTIMCKEERVDRWPNQIADTSMALIKQQGFHEVRTVPTLPTLRLPNPQFEATLWTTIRVNGFNASDEVDPMVQKLYKMV